MELFRQIRLQRLVASIVLVALCAALAPATAARTAREARLDAVLAHPEAVRAALAAADAAATPEVAVAVFVEAYRAATGRPVPADAVASAVADLFFGRAFRPVPPPETRWVAGDTAPVATSSASPAHQAACSTHAVQAGAERGVEPGAAAVPSCPDAAGQPPARAP